MTKLAFVHVLVRRLDRLAKHDGIQARNTSRIKTSDVVNRDPCALQQNVAMVIFSLPKITCYFQSRVKISC